MALFTGKKGLILGVANNFSIAWHIAKAIMDQDGVCGFSHLPDRPDDERKRNRMRVAKCTDTYPNNTKFLMPLAAATSWVYSARCITCSFTATWIRPSSSATRSSRKTTTPARCCRWWSGQSS